MWCKKTPLSIFLYSHNTICTIVYRPWDCGWSSDLIHRLWEEYYREILAVVSAGSHKEPTCSPRPCRHRWSFLTSQCPSVFCCIWLLAVEWFLTGLREVTVRYLFLRSPFTLSWVRRGRFLEHELVTRLQLFTSFKKAKSLLKRVLVKNKKTVYTDLL